MSEETHWLEIGGQRLPFLLRRSARTTLGIAVFPSGDTVVTAPREATIEAIEARVRKRAAWILAQRDHIFGRAAPATPRLCFPGETHLYLGRQYRLRVDPCAIGTRREGGRIIVGGVQPDETKRVRNRLNRWYASEARKVFALRLEECLKLFRPPPARPALRVMPLDKRWGSYASGSHTLILNRRLVEAATPQIDYVIVHELCHVAHGHHGRAFIDALTKVMPDWRERKKELEALGC